MERSLIWQNGIWLLIYNSSRWKISQCSWRAMIGHVLIGLWTLFSWYVMECKLFDGWVVSRRAEKTRFNLKMMQKGEMRTFHIPINLDLNRRGSQKGHKPLHSSKLAQSLRFMSFFVQSPLIHDIICKKAVTWLVRDTYPKRCDLCTISKCCDMYLNAAIWLERDTYPNAAIWLVQATYH